VDEANEEPPMPLKITCPNCRKPSHHADTNAGAVVVCPECRKQLRLPRPGPAKPAPPLLEVECVADDKLAVQPRPAPRSLAVEPTDELVDVEPVDEPPAPGSAAQRQPPPLPPPQEDGGDVPDVSAEDPEARKARKLGPVLATFPITASSLAWRTALGVGVCLVGLTLMVLGLLACIDISKTSILEALLGLVLCNGFGLVMLALGGFLLWRMVRDRGKKVLLSRRGFAVVHGGRRTVYHWEDVRAQYQHITEHYYNGAYTHTTHVYTLECVGGERVVFNDSLKNVKKLGEAVAEEITHRELPAAREEYDAGGLVSFGKLGVSRKGLTYGTSFLSWREVSGVRIHQGYVSVSKKGKWLNWCTIGAPSIPNLFVFLALVDDIIGLKDG
jgi:hypothetical protein